MNSKSAAIEVVLGRYGTAPLPGKKAFPRLSCALAMRLIEGYPRYVEVGGPSIDAPFDTSALIGRDLPNRLRRICTDRVCGVLTDFGVTDEAEGQVVRALLTPTGAMRQVAQDIIDRQEPIFMNGRFFLNPKGEIVDIVTWDLCTPPIHEPA